MKSLFWLLAVFAAAVALVILGRIDAGYVLLIYPPYRVEASLLFFAMAALGSFLILYALLRLLGHALALPATVRGFRARRRRERAQAALAAALQAYYEGRYARAEKEAALAFETGPTPGIAALLAARAAHQMRDFQRREAWLERAGGAGEALRGAQLMSRAELALDERDFTAARDALRSLHGSGPRHIATTRMLLRAERGAGAALAAGGTAVICNPASFEAVIGIAAQGERVPRKSTSFGPKPRTGLILRTFGPSD